MYLDDINCCCAVCDHKYMEKSCRLFQSKFGQPNLMPDDCKKFKNFE